MANIKRIPADMIIDRATGKKLDVRLKEIDQVYNPDELIAARGTYDSLGSRFNAVETVNANAELATARGTFPVLNDRLTSTETSLSQKATKTELQAVASGSPKGVYATQSALQTAFPTGNTNTYVVSADNNWYYWNGSAWTAGGLYQSSPVINDSAINSQTTYSSQLLDQMLYDKESVIYGNSLAGTYKTPTFALSILGTSTLRNGRIKTINLLISDAGFCEILAYTKLSNGNFKFLQKIYEGSVVTGTNNITIDCYIGKNVYLGFYSGDARLLYQGGGSSYRTTNSRTGDNISVSTIDPILGMNFEIQYDGLQVANDNINNLQTQASEVSIFDIGTTITSDFYNDGGWVDNLSPTNANSILYFNKSTSFDKWIAKLEVKLRDTTTTTQLVMVTKVQTGHNNTMLYVTFDLANQLIKIHQNWDGNVANEPPIIVQGTIPFTLDYTKTYVLTLERDTVGHVIAGIYDKDSIGTTILNKFSIDHYNIDPYGIVHGNSVDGVGIIHKAGSYYRNHFSMSAKVNPNPTIAIFGDSYTEGWALTIYGDVRYASLIRNQMLKGQVSISCRGGEGTTGLLEKMDMDLSMIKAKYTLLSIGINDVYGNQTTFEQYKANMSKIIEKVRNNGSIPILVTILKADPTNPMYDQINDWVRNYSGCRYVDFNKVFSLSDGTKNTALFLTGDIHPNVAGNQKMADKFMLDCDYVFSNNPQVTQESAIITPTFTNSWVARPGYAVGYTKDAIGRVQLYGLVQAGTIGTSCFTLPNEFRPNYSKSIPVVSNGVYGYVSVNANGNVVISAGSSTWVALDSISFYAGR